LKANSRRPKMGKLFLWGLFFLGAVHSAAQQKNDKSGLPDAPSTQSTSANPFRSGAYFVELLQRKSVVFPDLAVNTARLSTEQKFQLAANNSVALGTVGAAVLSAGWNQAFDRPAGYGQGAAGYGKRFGSGMARAASNQMFGTFLLASALHQDPRFFVVDHLTLVGSVKYSLTRVFVTRGDDGTQQANWSGLMAPLASEALASTYFPPGDRGANDVFRRYGYDLLWKAVSNLGKQYWPKINKQLRLQPAPVQAKPPSPGSKRGDTAE
jgi:hypothetical protein